MLEQVKGGKEDEIKKVLIEACCGEESKLASHFKEKGGESSQIYLPKHDMSKDHPVKPLKETIESQEEEGFEVRIWISIPCSPGCSWQRVNLKTVPNFEERLNS